MYEEADRDKALTDAELLRCGWQVKMVKGGDFYYHLPTVTEWVSADEAFKIEFSRRGEEMATTGKESIWSDEASSSPEVGGGPGMELDGVVQERQRIKEKKHHLNKEMERLEEADQMLAKKAVELIDALQGRVKASG